MAVSSGMIAKAAATVLSNEKLRKGVGWTLVAILSPIIVLIALLCSIGSGGADHNNQAVAASFYGVSYSTEVPAEFRYHIEEMRTAFSLLDSAVASVNGRTEGGNSLDPIRVKAVFYALCFGEDAPSARAASRFVECFYTWETRTRTVDIENDDGTVTSMEEEYTVAVPVSLYQAYANLEAELGRTITEDDKSTINHIYSMIVGAAGGGHAAAAEHAFHHGAVLIGQTDDDCFAAGGHMTEGQRPHVACNDALFLCGNAEHPLCIDAGITRMGEAVHLKQPAQAVEGALVMPVIQIKIMQQGPHRQRGLVGVQMQTAVEPEAHQRHILAMLVGGDRTVLDILPHPLYIRVMIVFFYDGIKLFALDLRKLHAAKFPFALR